MSTPENLKTFENEAELLLRFADEAIERGDSEQARVFVIRAIRQGLVLRHLRANSSISKDELQRIMKADPEELYWIFVEDDDYGTCQNGLSTSASN